MYHVIGADGKEYGPITADQVRQWIVERRLNATSLARVEGASTWQPLTFFAEFAGPLASIASAGYAAPVYPKAHNSMAVAGLVTGALGIVCCGCGPLFAILGIVFSVIALSQIRENPDQGGKGVAIAGLVLGGIALLEFALLALAGVFGRLLDQL